MKRRYSLSPEAILDLAQTWQYLSRRIGVSAADEREEEILGAIELLARSPGLGHWRQDLTSEPVKFLTVGRHVVVYRPDTRPLHVVAIVDGLRDVAKVIRLRS